MQMKPRERVLTALQKKQPDRVPWIEIFVHTGLASKVIGRETAMPPNWQIPPDIYKVLSIDNVTYDIRPPIFAIKEYHGDIEHIREPLLKGKEDLNKLKEFLPNPDNDELYSYAKELLAFSKKNNLAAIVCVRLGLSNTYNSMGFDNFCYALYDDPEFIQESMDIYGRWCIKAIERINNMGFDIAWITEDVAFKWGPMVSPEQFRKTLLPHMKNVAKHIALPKIYHTDGNPVSILNDLLEFNIDGFSNLEHGAVDIFEVKEMWGDRFCLVGNIDLNYTLTLGTPEETVSEVKEKIEKVGKGGGYIVASSNGLTEYCKPENVLAMNNAILQYGLY